MTNAMRTAVLTGPRKFEIVERQLPEAREDEVIVKIDSTAVCHTDLDMYTGGNKATRYPVVLGHESTGTVAALGSDISGLKEGQGVLINPVITCGHCDSCDRGLEHLCRNAGLFGREVEGSLSQYVSLPAKYLFPLPEGMPLNEATIIETLATVRHAQVRTQIKVGESVVVLGQGATGLLHTRLAVLTGCEVIAVSRTRKKLEMALAMGARHVIDRNAEEAVGEVMRLTGGNGADVVIDTAGGAKTMKAGIDMLRPGGRFCSFSLSHDPVAGVSPFPLYYKEVTIVGSRALTAADMRPSIDLVASGRIKVADFITASYPLNAAEEAFCEYEGNPGKVLRIVIEAAIR